MKNLLERIELSDIVAFVMLGLLTLSALAWIAGYGSEEAGKYIAVFLLGHFTDRTVSRRSNAS